ncbi:PREDICTED: uncharacterized protein LOC109161665 [Ipomoea nil]|uniref:uncharacterized protein LOC109161665 n=1 Tax=Ipomoea nil TaxID=35883 RepID=UPI0009008DBD|nr:PREDICTED: uncharacterized protein LOC109161665 [Ipomoea nil]
MVSSKKPDFVFLIETKVDRDHAERLRVKLGFDGLFCIDSSGLSGGLALLWRANNTARLISYSTNYVDVEVTIPGFEKWRMTRFYGFSQRGQRRDSWDLIRSLAGRSDLPWVMIGDFNDLLFQSEKRGGNPHPERLLHGFDETIEECGLAQMHMMGYPFTWEKGKCTPNWIEERLDKVLASQSWRENVPDASVQNILTRKSDHSALFLGILNLRERTGGLRRGFRFEMAWLHDEGCRGVVERAWSEGAGRGLQECISLCGNRLMRWGGERFHKFGERFRNLRKEQLRLRGCNDPASLAEFQRLEECLCRIEVQEDAYWRQRAKQHWLKNADANTKYYHSGDWVEGEAMRNVVYNYYKTIFTSGSPSGNGEFFGSIASRVTHVQNLSLLRPFDVSEHFWDVVGGDVSDHIVNCLNTHSFPARLNDTNIILIPKKKSPELVSDYRPIALSNVVYRIMAKVIAARMKPLMGEIISDTQSAFISDRLITDNILIAAEVRHYLNRKQCGITGWGALKLDMAKAYDRVEWPFLRSMMIALGFDERWVELIMLCVTSVSYSIQVGGTRSEQITPTRGLRQGDPLSPYLFIICAEGLSLLLQQAQLRGDLHGATAQEAWVVKQCLSLYEEMSGQAVNYYKSSICYSKNTRDEHREEIAGILGVVQAPNFGKYLGLPSFVGRNRRAVFSYIDDKIRQRIGSWNKKLLSQAAVERSMNRYWWRSKDDQGIHWKAWRLLTKPESLVSRIFKARYYPKGTFFDACIGNNPSFCWRSIMAAQELIRGGVRRRIGDGKTTLVWDHPWLQDETNAKVMTEKPPYLAQATVMGLIDQETTTWDHDILTDIFDPEDVARILKIPVAPDYEDMWYWYGDITGEYSVKSGYRQIVGNYVQTTGMFDKWPKLWKLKVPPRWKAFLWRALNDILPTTRNLIIKRVEISPTCAMCGVMHEDVMHSLVRCDYTRSIWAQSHLPIPSTITDIFHVWFNEILNILDDDGTIFAVGLLYYIWRARNGAVWDACLPRPRKIIAAVIAATWAWQVAHPDRIRPQPTPHGPATVTPIQRQGPERQSAAVTAAAHMATFPRITHGTIRNKCFFDAAYFHTTNKAVVGAILLDEHGSYISAFQAPLIDCLSPLMAETIACKEVLSWLWDRGERSVGILTDCLTLQQYLTLAKESPRSYLGYAIDTCRNRMVSFDYVSVSFVPRSDNYLAHVLATSAVNYSAAMYSDSDPPDSISTYFQ